jgi:prevent-host-death family protein
MTTVNIHEAKTNFSRLLEEVQAGREVIIAKRGKKIARLCPIESEERRSPGLLQGKVDDAFFDALPEAELEAWER